MNVAAWDDESENHGNGVLTEEATEEEEEQKGEEEGEEIKEEEKRRVWERQKQKLPWLASSLPATAIKTNTGHALQHQEVSDFWYLLILLFGFFVLFQGYHTFHGEGI